MHGIYALPDFPSIKIPVTIEWSSCDETEVAKILELYVLVDRAPDAIRPRCMGFFEASDVGRIGFVFVDRDTKAQLSLWDLIGFKPKPDAEVRGRLANAVVDCIQHTWELTDGQCECHLWSGSVRCLDSLHPTRFSESPLFLTEFVPPVIPQIPCNRERLLYLHPHTWDRQDIMRIGSIKYLGGGIRWALGVILLEISSWKTFRDILSLKEGSSTLDMSAAVEKFWDTLSDDLYVIKSPKVSQVVRFCLQGKGEITVPELCISVKKMLQD